MKITDIIAKYQNPNIYEPGTAFMWTDEHISKHLLKTHLDENIDLASRRKSIIHKTANWILGLSEPGKKLNILDLGCGPGLYCEIFARHGHEVTGIDISKTSIDYAKKSAKEKKLHIEYLCSNYLDVELEAEKYDLVVMIYTDLGVLKPEDRELVINKVQKSLKPGGIFVFDLLRDADLENKLTPKTWDNAETGFWKNSPYLALSESKLYKDEKVILYQHIIFDERSNPEIYRFWTQHFSMEDVTDLLEPYGFSNLRFRNDILPPGDQWSGGNVFFTIAKK
jgi:2-polyprenyl-3-methyl-5-hydroxy-6-metoxy-1,4-benzoquinol methylase